MVSILSSPRCLQVTGGDGTAAFLVPTALGIGEVANSGFTLPAS